MQQEIATVRKQLTTIVNTFCTHFIPWCVLLWSSYTAAPHVHVQSKLCGVEETVQAGF
jgi:hypothetical protein